MSCIGNACIVSPPRKTVDRIREITPAPIVKRCIKRNPTPPGDIIERVIVKRQPQTIIERITEQPRKPCPRVIERVEFEPAPPPLVVESCVYVEPTPRPCPLPVPAPVYHVTSVSLASPPPPPSHPCY
jgi:hypothetical protein